MGKDEEILTNMAGRASHSTGAGTVIPDPAKRAAKWALDEIWRLRKDNAALQQVNDEIGPAYHEWRAYSQTLLDAIREAREFLATGHSVSAEGVLFPVVEANKDSEDGPNEEGE